MSLPKTYCEKTLLLSRDCDLGGLWKPSAILTAMQETAGMHSHILGCGRETLVQKGVVWVLTRCEVQMEKEARMGSRLSIETFPMPLRRWFFPRYFCVPGRGGRAGGRSWHFVGAVRSGKALHGGSGRRGRGHPRQFRPHTAPGACRGRCRG